MKWPVRKLLPVLGVSAVAIFVAFPPAGEQQAVVPVVRNGTAQPSVQAATGTQQAAQSQQAQTGRIELERLERQKAGAENGKAIGNAFKSTSWYIAPPAPPPPPPPPPAAPTAPPLPFTYMGRYEDPPKRLVILAAGSKVYTVSEGEVIEGNYRVEHVTDSAVDLVYLPLNITQSVSTMGAPENPQHRLGFAERYRRP